MRSTKGIGVQEAIYVSPRSRFGESSSKHGAPALARQRPRRNLADSISSEVDGGKGGLACPHLHAPGTPPRAALSRALAYALQHDGIDLMCGVRGARLNGDFARDVCLSDCHRDCPFLDSVRLDQRRSSA